MCDAEHIIQLLPYLRLHGAHAGAAIQRLLVFFGHFSGKTAENVAMNNSNDDDDTIEIT